MLACLRFWINVTLLVSVMLGMSACGGGGGGGATGATSPASVVGDTYVGFSSESAGGDGGSAGAAGGAGDGSPIANAQIQITDSTGKTVAATTDNNGYYKADVTGFTAPLVATVTKGTRVLTSFTTRAPALGKTVTINITGLTDKIASDIVQANGGIGAVTLTSAIVKLQSSKIVSLLKAVNTSISDLLRANGLDPVSFDPMTTILVTNHTGYDAVLDSLNITNGPSVPTRIVPLTPLEAAQQLIKDLRDTAGAYSNTSNTGELDTAGDKLDNAVKAATSPLDEDVLKTVLLFNNAETLYNSFRSGTSPNIDLVSGAQVFGQTTTKRQSGAVTSPGFLQQYGCELDQVTTQTTVAGDTDLATSRYAGAISLSSSTSAPPLLPSEVNAFSCFGVGTSGRLLGTQLDDGFSRYHVITFIPQSDGSFKYVSQVRKRPFDMTGIYPSSATGSISTRDGAAKFGTVTRTRAASGDLTSWSITGQLKPGFKHLRNRTVAEWTSLAHETVSLNIADDLGTSSRILTLGGSISLVNTDGTVASNLTIAPTSKITMKEDLTKVATDTYFSGTFSCSAPFSQQAGTSSPNIYCTRSYPVTFHSLSDANLGLTVSAPGVKFEGTFLASDPKRDVTATDTSYQVTSASFVGKIYESEGAGGYRELLEGTVTRAQINREVVNASSPATAGSYLKQTWGFNGKLLLKDRPVVTIDLKALNDSYITKSMTGSFVWDGAFGFNIVADKNDVTGAGSTTFSSPTDVKFTLPRGASSSPQKIYKGTLEVGTITLSTKRVDYTDGSFEQF